MRPVSPACGIGSVFAQSGRKVTFTLPVSSLESRMRALIRLICWLVLACATVALAACAASPQQESTGEILDDSVITTKVKTSILADSSLKFFDIHVATARGVVQLSGTVTSRAASDRAAQLAGGTPGVKSVTNSLQVQ
jgi:hyperosmotically inducible protein